MEKEKVVLHRARDMQAKEGNNSFAAFLQQNGDEFRRDVFLALFPEHTALGRIQAGITEFSLNNVRVIYFQESSEPFKQAFNR